MQHEHLMTPAERVEMLEIRDTVADAAARRARIHNRLRQRAYRIRQKDQDQ